MHMNSSSWTQHFAITIKMPNEMMKTKLVSPAASSLCSRRSKCSPQSSPPAFTTSITRESQIST
jgi:hypothetical protein